MRVSAWTGLLVIVLGGCSGAPDTTAEGYPIIRNIDQAVSSEARAQALSSGPLSKVAEHQALTDEDKKDLREAARLTEGQSLFDPQAYGPFWRLGQIYVAVGDYDKGIDRLRSFIRLSPTNDITLAVRRADARFLIAQAYAAKQQYQGAISELDKALADYPNTPPYLLLRAQSYEKIGDTAKSRADIFAILQKHPESPEAQLIKKLARKGSGR